MRAWLKSLSGVFAILCVLGSIVTGQAFARSDPSETFPTVVVAQLPQEAHSTLALIRRNGPFPYDRDGVVFGNFERKLPVRQRGYYHEYTVPTPGLTHRGARRIVSGREGEFYYTQDHYRSFRRIVE